jgi:hypothetical protein
MSEFYVIEIPYESLNFSTWIPYSGEMMCMYDWWNSSPCKYNSIEDALVAINADTRLSNGHWRIVKNVTITEVVKESIA